MANPDIHELSAAYALDVLDSDEERAFEEHLAGCATCQADVAAFRETAGTLALGAPPAEPPPALRSRILDAVAEERATVVPFRRRRITPVLGSLAAAAAAVAIGLGLWAQGLHSDLSAARSDRQAMQTAMRIVASPGADHVALSNGHGTLVVAPSGAAALVLRNLGPAPAGKTYEAWVIEGRRPKPAGVFQAAGDGTVVALEHVVPAGATVAVTVEPAGGVEEPTSEPLVTTLA